MAGSGLETRINNLAVAIGNIKVPSSGSINLSQMLGQQKNVTGNTIAYNKVGKTSMTLEVFQSVVVDSDNGVLYVGGGSGKEWWKVDLSTGIETQLTDINVTTSLAQSKPFYYDGNIYLIGGLADASATSAIRKYNIIGNSWSTIVATLQAPNNRTPLYHDVLNSRLYIMGGSTNNVDAHYLDLTDDSITNLTDIGTSSIFINGAPITKTDNFFIVYDGATNDYYSFTDLSAVVLTRSTAKDYATAGGDYAYSNHINDDLALWYNGNSATIVDGIIVNRNTGNTFVLNRDDITLKPLPLTQHLGGLVYDDKIYFLGVLDEVLRSDAESDHLISFDLNYMFVPVAEVSTGQTVDLFGICGLISSEARGSILNNYQFANENQSTIAASDGTLYILLTDSRISSNSDGSQVNYLVR